MLFKAMSFVNKIGKTQDSVLTGLLGGLIGTIFMDVSNEAIYKAGKTEGRYANVAGQMFVSPLRTKQTKNFVLGEILHLAIGSIFGIPLVYLFKKTGKDHSVAKGIVTSILTWGVLYTGGQKVGLFKRNHLTKTHYSAMFNNLVYGLATSKAILSIADPAMFKDSGKSNLTAMNSKNNGSYNLEPDEFGFIREYEKPTYLH